jgi:hypothetical protein
VTGRLFSTYALTDMQPAKRVEGYDTLPTVRELP